MTKIFRGPTTKVGIPLPQQIFWVLPSSLRPNYLLFVANKQCVYWGILIFLPWSLGYLAGSHLEMSVYKYSYFSSLSKARKKINLAPHSSFSSRQNIACASLQFSINCSLCKFSQTWIFRKKICTKSHKASFAKSSTYWVG